MDFLFEALLQILVELIGELVGEILIDHVVKPGARLVTATRWLRQALGSLLGLGFGLAWGAHLDGGAHWPRLLWFSLGLIAGTLVLMPGRPGREDPGRTRRQRLRDTLRPPWRWSRERLAGFALINAGVALGIAVTFRPR